uniref:Ig-like domain-containing protein n=1 Tax=Salarias fasciatus TaxID=181472 RepID=A0A672IC59_SALFA
MCKLSTAKGLSDGQTKATFSSENRTFLCRGLRLFFHLCFYLWNTLLCFSEEVTSCGKLKVVPSFEPLFTRKLDVLEVIEGRNARFDCKVSGTPPPKVIWSHFDHALTESEDVRIVQEAGRHSLIISHVTNDDEGFYTVVARNAHGEAESSAELYIQEPRPAISSQM